MDADRFETLSRLMSDGQSRRRIGQVLTALAFGTALGQLGLTNAEARRRRRRRRRSPPPSPPPPPPPGCFAPAECPGTDTECEVRTCSGGACGMAFVASGTPTLFQNAGDCHVRVCDGAGSIRYDPDDADLPDDGNPCTINQCVSGSPRFPPAPAGTFCPTGFCDGSGACV